MDEIQNKNIEQAEPIERKRSVGKGFGITAMVCGICGLVFFFVPYLNIVLAIVALVFGIIALSKKMDGKGMAIAGVVTGGISFVSGLLFMIFTVWLVSSIVTPIVDEVQNIDVENSWDELVEWSNKVNVCLEEKGIKYKEYDQMTSEERTAYWDCM